MIPRTFTEGLVQALGAVVGSMALAMGSRNADPRLVGGGLLAAGLFLTSRYEAGKGKQRTSTHMSHLFTGLALPGALGLVSSFIPQSYAQWLPGRQDPRLLQQQQEAAAAIANVHAGSLDGDVEHEQYAYALPWDMQSPGYPKGGVYEALRP